MHTLRHTAAMRLLHAGNDVTVIALWFGHEQIATTNLYRHADMTQKQQAIDRTQPLGTKPGPTNPLTPCSPSLKGCDYADPDTSIIPTCNTPLAKVGITRTSA